MTDLPRLPEFAEEPGHTSAAAAVRSMTVSWKNVLFDAFDPGGFQGAASGGVSASGQKGSAAVMQAVSAVCAPVTSNALPAQYQASLYDCQGRAAQTEAYGTTGG